MAIEKYSKSEQGYGEFNGGAIVENKPIGFPQEGEGGSNPYSNLFYWAHASSEQGSTIGEHPHQAFEILSFVLTGDIEHFDSHNKKWFPLSAGDVQVIKSGSGIYHSEKINPKSSIFQIWFNPDFEISMKQPAEYSDYKSERFEIVESDNYKSKIIIGGSSPINLVSEDVEIQEITALNNFTIKLSKEKYHSFYVLEGSAKLNDESIQENDFIKIYDENEVSFTNLTNLKLFYISNPKELTHRTYFQMNQMRYK